MKFETIKPLAMASAVKLSMVLTANAKTNFKEVLSQPILAKAFRGELIR